MKLYTEEQVREMLQVCQDSDLYEDILTFDDILKTQISIELPTDEEIRKESHDYFIRGQLGFEAAADTERAFLRGVLWMRDKILNK